MSYQSSKLQSLFFVMLSFTESCRSESNINWIEYCDTPNSTTAFLFDFLWLHCIAILIYLCWRSLKKHFLLRCKTLSLHDRTGTAEVMWNVSADLMTAPLVLVRSFSKLQHSSYFRVLQHFLTKCSFQCIVSPSKQPKIYCVIFTA